MEFIKGKCTFFASLTISDPFFHFMTIFYLTYGLIHSLKNIIPVSFGKTLEMNKML